jgi:hypothetical protein
VAREKNMHEFGVGYARSVQYSKGVEKWVMGFKSGYGSSGKRCFRKDVCASLNSLIEARNQFSRVE